MRIEKRIVKCELKLMRKCYDQDFELWGLPDRKLHDFRASKSVDRQSSRGSQALIVKFHGSKTV